jgi:hypothetical protein
MASMPEPEPEIKIAHRIGEDALAFLRPEEGAAMNNAWVSMT